MASTEFLSDIILLWLPGIIYELSSDYSKYVWLIETKKCKRNEKRSTGLRSPIAFKFVNKEPLVRNAYSTSEVKEMMR